MNGVYVCMNVCMYVCKIQYIHKIVLQQKVNQLAQKYSNTMHLYVCITQYGSTVYIGIAMVYQH